MRTELYEMYKEKHPEELKEVNRLFDYDQKVRVIRAYARAEKVKRVDKWIEILGKEGNDE